MDLLQLIVW